MKIVAKITAALKLEFSVRSSTLDESIPRCDSVLLRRKREKEREKRLKKRAVRKIFRDVFFGGQD